MRALKGVKTQVLMSGKGKELWGQGCFSAMGNSLHVTVHQIPTKCKFFFTLLLQLY